MGKGVIKNRLDGLEDAIFGKRKSFMLAFVISVIGSLGVGALNVAAVQFSATKGLLYAFSFSLGCVLVEAVFVRYAALLTRYFSRSQKAKKLFEWGSLILLLLLAFACFFSGEKSSSPQNGMLENPTMPGLFLGMLLRVLTPTMFPFWLGWKAVIVGKGIQYLAIPFAFGAAVGTLLMHCLYILAGQYALDFLGKNAQYMSWGIGFLLFLSAILQAQRMYSGKKKTT